MIIGTVNAHDEAVIPLVVLDAQGREHALEAVIDTRFSGYLTLPPTFIDALGLAWRTRLDVLLGDGSSRALDVFAATVLWDGRPLAVETAAADVDPLVGMGMLRGYVLEMQVTEDGLVRIEPLT